MRPRLQAGSMGDTKAHAAILADSTVALLLFHCTARVEFDPSNSAAIPGRVPGRIAMVNHSGDVISNQAPDTGSTASSADPSGARAGRRRLDPHPACSLLRAAREAMLARHAPPYLVLDEQFAILHRSESAGLLLGVSEAEGNIAGLADGNLATTIRLAAGSAMANGLAVSLRDISIHGSDGAEPAIPRRFDMLAEAVGTEGGRGALVILRDVEDGPHGDVGAEVDAFLMRLLRDTDVHVAILDRSLRLRSLTSAARGTLGVTDGDALPRDILGGVADPALQRDLSRVLADGRQIERSIDTATGQSCRATLMQVPAFDGTRVEAGAGGVAIRFEPVQADAAAVRRTDSVAEELNHRISNTLGTATALASLMLARAVSLPDFRAAFTRRLQALTSVNALVARDNWTGTELSVVLEQQIARRMRGMPPNIRLDGPPCRLRPRAAVTLGMAMDEMIVNAATHGAFARAGMAVSVSWRRSMDSNGAVILAIDWIESGGRQAGSDSGRGLGCLLIEHGIAHELSGRVAIDFAESGIRYRIEIPEGEMLADGRQEP